MGDKLYRTGVSVVIVSVVSNTIQLIVVSDNAPPPQWLETFNKITPYLVGVGLLLIFAGIILRNRRRRTNGPISN
jgi:hypothetical protein